MPNVRGPDLNPRARKDAYVRSVRNAFRAGKIARQDRKPRSACPYRRSDLIGAWTDGWKEQPDNGGGVGDGTIHDLPDAEASQYR